MNLQDMLTTSRSLKNIVLNVLLAAFSLVVVLLVAEFVTRFAFRDISTTPNMGSYFGARWQAAHQAKNSLGFRETEIDPRKTAGVTRTAIVGDSLTYGQGLIVSERFSNLLQADLNQRGPRAEVLNFGRPGADTFDAIRILNNTVLPLDPDFVLLQWFVNDVEDHDARWRQRGQPLAPWPAMHRYLYRNSALYYLLNLQWNNLRQQLGWNQPYVDYLLARSGKPGSAIYEEVAAPLRQFVADTRAHGASIGIVLFPQLEPDMGTAYPLQPLHDMVMSICDEEDLECLDLLTVYRRQGTDFDYQQFWVNRFDSHPGAEANRIAAEAIAEYFGERVTSK